MALRVLKEAMDGMSVGARQGFLNERSSPYPSVKGTPSIERCLGRATSEGSSFRGLLLFPLPVALYVEVTPARGPLLLHFHKAERHV